MLLPSLLATLSREEHNASRIPEAVTDRNSWQPATHLAQAVADRDSGG